MLIYAPGDIAILVICAMLQASFKNAELIMKVCMRLDL